MRLLDLVKIDNRFEKSINLLLDLNNPQKIQLYIPTRSSIRIITEFIREVNHYTGDRANILIGPYGKGKSHLLLVLLAILSGNQSDDTVDLIKRISSYDKDAGVEIKNVYRKKKLLPVIVNANSANLATVFLRSLNQALSREGLKDVIPDNYFTEAQKTIVQWKNDYPYTYSRLQEHLSEMTIDELMDRLGEFDDHALQVFMHLHPILTSGSTFNPWIDDDVLSVFQSVNRIICSQYSYSGIYIIFDEFSKYIEGHSEEGFSSDMKVLQDICELCNTSKDEQFHITFVAHRAIRSYGDQLSKSVKNAFRGVEGRIKETQFIVSSQNNYELIADAVKKTDQFQRWKVNESFHKMVDDSFQVPEFKALFKKDDFVEIVGEGAFPLTPVSAFLLLNISEKIAQNERTIFTFLTGNDVQALPSLIWKTESVSFVGANVIYDYFSQLMENEKDSSIHNEWLRAEYALSKTTDADQQAVIKTLAVIKMVNQPDDIPGNGEYIYLASGLDRAQCENACAKLLESEILHFKRGTRTYDFLNSVGINIGNEISNCALKYFSKTELPEVLNDVLRNRYILPKKYNQEYCMTRYYKIQYMEKDVFNAMASLAYLQDDKADGFLVLILTETEADLEEVYSHIKEIDDDRLIVAYIQNEAEYKEEAKLLLAAKRLMEDKEFLSENEAAITELHLFSMEIINKLNLWSSASLAGITEIYSNTGVHAVGAKGLNRTISDICQGIYSKTPIINNELINRNNVSAQISKVRKNIIEDILNSRVPEKYLSGTSAESTIYRAVLIHTKSDAELLKVRRIILDYIHDCKGRKVPFSQLYNVLTQKPIGMRKGTIPIYLAEQLVMLEDMPVVYQDKKEISIDAQLLSNINESPGKYSLFVEEETVEKLEYIEGLEGLYKDYEAYCRELGNRNRLSRLICIMQSWYRSLPQTSVVFKIPDAPDQEIRKLILFRRLFTESPNPREILFEKIPKIYGSTSYKEALDDITKTKAEIDAHIHYLKKQVEIVVRKNLNLSENDDFYRCLKTWYEEVPENVKKSVFSSDSQRILNVIKNLSVTDSEEIVEQLAKASTHFYVEDWNDETIDEFSGCLAQLMTEISDKSDKKAKGAGSIIFSDGENNTHELIVDYDPSQISSTGYFFANALEELMEDYGETLENSEKIGILMNTIKKLLE